MNAWDDVYKWLRVACAPPKLAESIATARMEDDALISGLKERIIQLEARIKQIEDDAEAGENPFLE